MSPPERGEVLMLPTHPNPYQEVLAEDLRALGWTVTLGQPGWPELSRLLAGRLPRVVHVHWLEAFFRPPSRVRLPGPLRRLAQVSRAALGLLALAMARLRGTRLVFTFHELHDHVGRFRHVKIALAWLVVRLVHVVLAHSAHAAETASAALGLPRGAIVVAPLPDLCRSLPDGPSRGEARRRLGLPAEARVLAFLGMVGVYKGVEDLLEAFRDLPGEDLRLVVAGSPNPEEYGDELSARWESTPRVTLRLGWQSEEDLSAVAAAADLLVFPYQSITTSSSVLLAPRAGRPALATRLANVPELLPEDTAILFPPGGLPAALTKALARWEQLPAMGRRAAAHYAQAFQGACAAAHHATYLGARELP